MPDRLIPSGVRARLGRRGLILLLFGLAWLIQGSAYFIFGQMGAGIFWHERLPASVIGLLWLASGLASMVAAFIKRSQNDTFGFLAVSGPPMVLAFSYGVGVFTRSLIGEWQYVLLGVLGFSIWGVITLALAVIASWHEPKGGERD